MSWQVAAFVLTQTSKVHLAYESSLKYDLEVSVWPQKELHRFSWLSRSRKCNMWGVEQNISEEKSLQCSFSVMQNMVFDQQQHNIFFKNKLSDFFLKRWVLLYCSNFWLISLSSLSYTLFKYCSALRPIVAANSKDITYTYLQAPTEMSLLQGCCKSCSY